MFDTINFHLQADAIKADFLAETSLYLKDTTEHQSKTGAYISGYITDNVDGDTNKLKVFVSAYSLSIKNQSLCKWHLGDNVKTLQRSDTKQAIQKISDLLHIDFSKADVKRIDTATNLILKHPVSTYFQYLGDLQYFSRFEQTNSLYYNQRNKVLALYDKVKEQKNNVSDLYKNRNVLRYEMRILRNILKELNQTEIKAESLYNEKFYIYLIDKYLQYFKDIAKVKQPYIDFSVMNNNRDIKKFYYLHGIKTIHGTLQNFNDYMNNADKKGLFPNKMQKSRLKQDAKKAFSLPEITTESTQLKELENKLKTAVKFYR